MVSHPLQSANLDQNVHPKATHVAHVTHVTVWGLKRLLKSWSTKCGGLLLKLKRLWPFSCLSFECNMLQHVGMCNQEFRWIQMNQGQEVLPLLEISFCHVLPENLCYWLLEALEAFKNIPNCTNVCSLLLQRHQKWLCDAQVVDILQKGTAESFCRSSCTAATSSKIEHSRCPVMVQYSDTIVSDSR